MSSSSGGPSGMSCYERPSSGDQVAAAGAHLCKRIAQNHPSAGGDPTWGITCMVTWTTSSGGGECVAARQHLAVQHRWRTGQCRIAAGSYSALGVAVHHRWRTGQGRIVAAHSSQNSELGGTACCSETLVFGCFGCVMFFLGREERVQIPDTQPWSPQSVNTRT